jgi:lipoprotein-releasing system permease protein
VDVRYEKDVTTIEKDVVAGSLDPLRLEMERAESVAEATTPVSPGELFMDRERTPGIVLGKELAKKLNGYSGLPREMEKQVLDMLINREIRVTSPVEERGPRGTRMRQNVFRIVAITESGLFDYDDLFAFISLKQAQYLYDRPERFTRIEVRLDDAKKAKGAATQIADRLERRTLRAYEPRVWMEFNRPLFAALAMERLAMMIILVMIILVAGFSVAATLIMTVLQKRREIGVLRAIGATEKGIRRIFLRCGALVGVVGATVGCSLGFLICYILDLYKLNLPGGGQVYYIDKMPVEMRIEDFALVAGVTVVTCVLAAIYPARLAARLVPVEALRYE